MCAPACTILVAFVLLPALLDLLDGSIAVAAQADRGGDPPTTWANLAIALGATSMSTLFATPMAVALARARFPGRNAALFTVATATAAAFLLPGSSASPSPFAAFRSAVALGLPVATWLVYFFACGLPRNLETAARMDGAETQVLLGALRPAILASAAAALAISWRILAG